MSEHLGRRTGRQLKPQRRLDFESMEDVCPSSVNFAEGLLLPSPLCLSEQELTKQWSHRTHGNWIGKLKIYLKKFNHVTGRIRKLSTGALIALFTRQKQTTAQRAEEEKWLKTNPSLYISLSLTLLRSLLMKWPINHAKCGESFALPCTLAARQGSINQGPTRNTISINSPWYLCPPLSHSYLSLSWCHLFVIVTDCGFVYYIS